MTKTLDRLERADLARRRSHPSDRRRFAVVLTNEGAALTDRVFRAQLDAQHAVLEGVGEAKRRQFNRVIEELIRRFVDHAVPEDLECLG